MSAIIGASRMTRLVFDFWTVVFVGSVSLLAYGVFG